MDVCFLFNMFFGPDCPIKHSDRWQHALIVALPPHVLYKMKHMLHIVSIASNFDAIDIFSNERSLRAYDDRQILDLIAVLALLTKR